MAFGAAIGQIGSGFGGALPDSQLKWLQLQEAKQNIAQYEQELAAQGAMGATWGAQGPQGLPQQGPQPPPPGAPSVPNQQLPPAQGGAIPGSPNAGPAGGGPMAPPPSPPQNAPPGGAGPGASPSPSGAPNGGGMQQNAEGAQRLLREMAQTIKAANPGISNVVLAQAVQAQVRQIAPLIQAASQADKLQVQQLMNESRLQNQRDIAEFKGNLAQIIASSHDATRITISGMAGDRAAAGRNASMDRTTLVQNREDARQLQRQAFEAQQHATTTQDRETAEKLKVRAQRAQQIVNRMNNIQTANPVDADAQLSKLQGELDKINSESDSIAAGIGGGGATPAKPVSAGGLPAGTKTFTGPGGKRIYWDGNAWQPVPAGQ
jgi:hypothetical protein